jgi:hypothetical protein
MRWTRQTSPTLLFVCGPAAGWQVEELLDRFGNTVKIAVGVSVVAGTPERFDAVLARDGDGSRPDLSLLAGRGYCLAWSESCAPIRRRSTPAQYPTTPTQSSIEHFADVMSASSK